MIVSLPATPNSGHTSATGVTFLLTGKGAALNLKNVNLNITPSTSAGALWVTPSEVVLNPPQRPALRNIFKYPSWKYPGEYAGESSD